ncbi:methylated-DNA--[protein]-cysteine S-methyltransferase [Streptomyces avicenniae]|uniref:methylated-DNA--[protein]-cysteine S-methyltransferase n=1 Tax=Streptomyces avicenniae TaxID=500153 RepID=UPI00069C6DAF|nr:methylated-DNA--[protein]-cysteine S-methyltransferase [Streptomyces avicenniae]
MLYTLHPSPLGDLLIAGPRPGVLASVSVPRQKGGATVQADWRRDDTAFPDATRQFDAYFAGERTTFDLVLEPVGSDFRRRVWTALHRIEYGATVTYGELTEMAGLPRTAVRAVGGAIGANPLSVICPCHRVIGADGSLTGYAGGLDRKRLLLGLEGVLPAQLTLA